MNTIIIYKPLPDKIPINKRAIINSLKIFTTIQKTITNLTNEKISLNNKRYNNTIIKDGYLMCGISSQCVHRFPPSGAPPVGNNSGHLVLSHKKDYLDEYFSVSLKGLWELSAVALISWVVLSHEKDFLVETLGSPLRGLSAIALIPSGGCTVVQERSFLCSVWVCIGSECCRTRKIIFLSICVYLASIVLVTHECYQI